MTPLYSLWLKVPDRFQLEQSLVVSQFESFRVRVRLYQKITPACAKKMPITIRAAEPMKPQVRGVGD